MVVGQKMINVGIDSEMLRRMELLIDTTGLAVNGQIRQAVERYVVEMERQKKEAEEERQKQAREY